MGEVRKMELMVNSTTPKADMIMEAIDDKKVVECALSATLINNIPGRFGVYHGEVSAENLVGIINTIDAKKPDQADINAIVISNPVIMFDGYADDRRAIFATLDMPSVEIENVGRTQRAATTASKSKRVIKKPVIKEETGTKAATPAFQDPNGYEWPINTALTLDEICTQVVARGYAAEEKVNSVRDLCDKNHMGENLQKQMFSRYRTYINESRKPKAVYIDPQLEEDRNKYGEGKLPRAIRAALMGVPVVCQGPKACGKNVFMETVAWMMNMPWYLLSFNRQMNMASFFGEKTTDNTAADVVRGFDPKMMEKARQAQAIRQSLIHALNASGISCQDVEKTVNAALTKEQKTLLIKAAEFEKASAQAATTNIIQEHSVFVDALMDGGVMIFNEMNMIDANTFSSIANPLTDGTGKILVPGKGEIPVHPDFVLFGTQNEDYEGVEDPNAATISRFKAITFEQPQNVEEILIRATESEVSKRGYDFYALTNSPAFAQKKDCFKQATAYYAQCMGSVGEEVSDAVLNIRGFSRALALYVCDLDGVVRLSGAIKEGVIDTCPMDERIALATTLTHCVTL